MRKRIPKVGNWYAWLRFRLRPYREGPFRPWVQVAFFKLLCVPSEGRPLSKGDYKGIFWEKEIRPVVIMYRRTFRMFKRYFSIDYPVKLWFD